LNFFPAGKGRFLSLAGIDLESEDKVLPLELALTSPSGSVQMIERPVILGQRKYGVQRLTLPARMVELDEKTLARVREEAQKLDGLWGQISNSRLFNARFILPVASKVSSPFGLRRIINGQERSPHTGIDIAAASGTAVKAANSGRVVFVDNLYFSGNSLVIDHGLGIFTMYFHLQSVALSKGELVKRGQILGRVGKTGRATGPNLHWGVRIGLARVDPLALIELPLP
jgi:murein DD-endopeptidase MepM/ murein hydrolase activator NlpD